MSYALKAAPERPGRSAARLASPSRPPKGAVRMEELDRRGFIGREQAFKRIGRSGLDQLREAIIQADIVF